MRAQVRSSRVRNRPEPESGGKRSAHARTGRERPQSPGTGVTRSWSQEANGGRMRAQVRSSRVRDRPEPESGGKRSVRNPPELESPGAGVRRQAEGACAHRSGAPESGIARSRSQEGSGARMRAQAGSVRNHPELESPGAGVRRQAEGACAHRSGAPESGIARSRRQEGSRARMRAQAGSVRNHPELEFPGAGVRREAECACAHRPGACASGITRNWSRPEPESGGKRNACVDIGLEHPSAMAWALKLPLADEVIESGLVQDFDASLSGIGQELGARVYSMRL
ncbi:uncharacterized protein LOC119930616 [Tachyglossus aculeatus]|uniref:uncharacterized protein LOC119930616 n=1 Tax=Tachyglossus aculeatus TaxID=9261 RepID=UPI0018F52796|nr:uncharacterized protein LOC119930616 [Tachyglossus aculeatus]